MQLYYKGKPVEDMTKEELIAALVELTDLYFKALDDHCKAIGLLIHKEE